jgi:hypothetical protein
LREGREGGRELDNLDEKVNKETEILKKKTGTKKLNKSNKKLSGKHQQ